MYRNEKKDETGGEKENDDERRQERCGRRKKDILSIFVVDLSNKQHADAPWPEISLGTILASSNATFRTPEGHIQQGAMRFQRIMMSESAHLIWKMRCERVIQNENEPTTKAEVNKRWIKAINLRLEMDCRMTDSKYEKKALAKGLVLDTWTGTLLNEDNLPQDWTRETGVLVGIRPQENDGRGRDR
ncbi:hypothetical protein BDZ97DRAFT_1764897 [Flammula alnicola]|nr:hypothetical protein BDZ97DRAFT_1764897 [Flammula alnicola]